MLNRWSGGLSPYPPGTLVELLDAGIALDPWAEAVVAEDGTLSFAELDGAASALACALVATGVRPEDRVVVLGHRSWRTVVAFVGVLRAGAAYVPLDPGQPLARLRGLIRSVGAAVVLGEGATPFADEFVTLPIERAARREQVRVPVTPGHAAYVIHTSGSTGTPRPVLIEHRSAAHLWHALKDGVHAAGAARLRVSLNAPFAFDASVKQLIQLASGHTVCVVPEQVRRDGRTLLEFLVRHRVDVLDCTPSHLRILLDVREPADRLPGTLLIGGEAIDAELWRDIAALEGVRAVNLYGPTECAVDVTAAEITADAGPTIGRPLPGLHVWVLDERLRPLPAGATGELCVSGPQVARGYYGNPRDTADRFVIADVPGGSAERLYRTGDLVRFEPDGRLTYAGRSDDQVKISGYRIEPGEVAAAMRRHPEVRQAVVVGSGGRLVGYAVPGGEVAAIRPDRIDGINAHETRYLFEEIFERQVYLRGGVTLRESAVIFDVGANIGMFALFAQAVCPDARVYAFEPLAPVFEKLERNISAHGRPATLLPYGLSGTQREETFAFYPGYSMMSGQRAYADPAGEIHVIRTYLENERERGLAGRHELLGEIDDLLGERFAIDERRCLLRRLSDVIDEQRVQRIDLLKIDVQRAELDVLHGLDERHWPMIQQVAMEVHDEPGGVTQGRLAHLADLFERHGFLVTTEQDELLAGTDRHSLYAVRPAYQHDPRPARSPAAMRAPIDGEDLRGWLAERLPEHLVPGAIIVLDALPLTVNGKVDRAALPAPEDHGRPAGAAPENPAEQILLEVWREVLGRADIGVEDKFFQLGGDSIRAIRVRVMAVRRGLVFPLRDLVRHQTIRELVRRSGLATARGEVERGSSARTAFTMVSATDRARLPAGLEDAYPVSALQLGMIYHGELSPGRTGYHVVTLHRVEAPLDAVCFETALRATFAGHPVLRTSFDLGHYGEPLQLVHRDVRPELVVEDVRPLGDTGQRDRVTEVLATQRARPFDWGTAPLLRFHVLRTGDDAFQLVLSHHHGVLDGWSLHLLLEEVCTRYEAALAGADSPGVPPGAVPYRRFVELEREATGSAESITFWRDVLAGTDPLNLARRDGARPPRISAEHTEPLSTELTRALRKVAAEREIPLKSVLLAAYLRVLGEESGRDDVVGGLVVSGRPDEEGGDRTLGLFLNTLPVPLRLGVAALLDLAAHLWQAERDLTGHHLVPLADIERAARRGPLFDTFFNFTNFQAFAGPGKDRARRITDRDAPVDVAFSLVVDVDVNPVTDQLGLTLQYDAERLSAARIRRITARYRELLERAGAGLTPLPRCDDWAARVSGIWRELTGGPAPTGPDSFLDSGGNSLLALRFVAALRDRHGVEVDLRAFLRAGRYAAVAWLVAQAAATDTDRSERVEAAR